MIIQNDSGRGRKKIKSPQDFGPCKMNIGIRKLYMSTFKAIKIEEYLLLIHILLRSYCKLVVYRPVSSVGNDI